MPYFCFFFFSSRRRHTRCGRDWSSDVCSSDLRTGLAHSPATSRRMKIASDSSQSRWLREGSASRSARDFSRIALMTSARGRGPGGRREKDAARIRAPRDRKSTRLNSSHVRISYAVFCLKKKKKKANEYFYNTKKKKKQEEK